MSLSVNEFLDHSASRGLIFNNDIIMDGQLHRVHLDGDKKGKKNGWYIYHDEIIPVCIYGTWKGEQKYVWSARHESELNKSEMLALKRKMAEASRNAKRIKKLEQTQCAVDASETYDRDGVEVVSHSYLSKKLISTNEILRIAVKGSKIKGTDKDISIDDCLMIPVVDPSYNLASMQYIFPNGFKMFHPGGRISGCFCPLKGEGEVIFVCEGYATGATINETTGNQVYVAFNCGNLYEVARHVKSSYPHNIVIIAGDDDKYTTKPMNNPGKHHAEDVSRRLNINAIYPIFGEKRKQKDTDFNDMNEEGITHGINNYVKDSIDIQLEDIIGSQLA